MNGQEKKGLLKLAVGLIGAAAFAIFGVLARRRGARWAVAIAVVGVLGSLAYAYTGYREYRMGEYGALVYGAVPQQVYDCKVTAFGPFWKLDEKRCEPKD